jgi:hypothetical protein
MRLWSRIAVAVAVAFVPLVASAQFSDLDAALQNLTRGFGSGDPQAIVSGVTPGDKVMLQFPGLITESGFYGRDQVAYLLDGLFNKVHPTAFEQQKVKKEGAEPQYTITALWTISVNGKPETRTLYVQLKKQGEKWAVTSVQSGGK